MLTADLVNGRVRKGELRLGYIDADSEDALGLAASMIGIFESAVGKTQRELDESLRDLLGTGTAFLLHRGLAKLLRDRCELETVAPVDPEALRAATFAAAASEYRDGDPIRFDREAVRDRVCSELELAVDGFDAALYADLKDEQVVTKFKKCDAPWLLRRYNVALAQAAVLRADSLVIRIRESSAARLRAFFHRVKFCRLLFDIERDDEDAYVLRLDGPMSVFKSSQKYGVQLAMFLPALLHLEGFRLESTVRHGPKRREVAFSLEKSEGLEPVDRLRGQWRPEEVDWLAERFAKLGSDWTMSEEARVLDLGRQGVVIADATFMHEPTGFEVGLELLGYWRRGSVATRLQLLREHAPIALIVAASKELRLADDELTELGDDVVVFRATPVARDVLAALERVRQSRKPDGNTIS